MNWRIHHKTETVSTNLDARAGIHGDVYTADFQTAGRGRLDHKWQSPPGANLMMSVVLGVGARGRMGAEGGMVVKEIPPEEIATLPLVIGLAVVRAIRSLLPQGDGERSPRTPPAELLPLLKWPNDVLVGGRKVSGILCERHGDFVIAGIGVNVEQRVFPPEIAKRATSIAELMGSVPKGCGKGCGERSPRTPPVVGSVPISVEEVRDAVLGEIGALYEIWRAGGLAAVYPEIQAVDCLRGQTLAVKQTDDDAEPIRGVCGGIASDGSLLVGSVPIYAGEAHVLA